MAAAPWLVDCHCHLLAGLDDGPKSADESLKLCAVAIAQGIRVAAATVHQLGPFAHNVKDTILAHVELLQARLEEEELPLVIHPSAEWMINADWVEQFDQVWPDLLTISNRGTHALIEFPYECPFHTNLIAEQLAAKHLQPVLAHVDRYENLLYQPRRVTALIEQGFLVQLNANVLTAKSEKSGSRARAAAKTLLRGGLVHFVASDAHDSINRAPRLAEAYRTLVTWLGDENARLLTSDNPQALLDGRDPQAITPSRWWHFG